MGSNFLQPKNYKEIRINSEFLQDFPFVIPDPAKMVLNLFYITYKLFNYA